MLLLGDGSYAVHMIMIAWPHHVFVSKDFVTFGAVDSRAGAGSIRAP